MFLWLVLFLMCFGLGYPTLNRYDTRTTGGLSDTESYYKLAVNGPHGSDDQLQYRMLIPLMTRPVTALTRGHIGTWDPVFLGFLVVNSFFVASTAWLTVVIATALGFTETIGLLAAALYLLNFETANIRLSAMVDSAEGCFMLAVVWALLMRRYGILVLSAAIGAAAKETFVPLVIAFITGWWWFDRRNLSWRVAAVPCVAAVVAITAIQSVIQAHLFLPWQFAGGLRSSVGPIPALINNLFDQNLFYCLVWLLPLGLPRLRHLPFPWLAGALAAVLMDFALVGYHGSVAGAAARPFFSAAGPLLSLSAAIFVLRPGQEQG